MSEENILLRRLHSRIGNGIKRNIRLIVNWTMYLTMPLWIPFVFYVAEIMLIRRMLGTSVNKRCDTYKALFSGEIWFFGIKDLKEIFFGG